MNFGDLLFQLLAIGTLFIPFILLVVVFRVYKKHQVQLKRIEQKMDHLIKIYKEK